jgi:ABC-type glycerol-3-phosphate transport system substrate-binding protein
MNNSLRRLVLLMLALAAATAFSGCQSNDQDSAVPWARPQSWEGQQPALGGP